MAASRSSRVTRSSVGLNGLDENFCGRTLRNRSIAQPEETPVAPPPRARSPKKRQDSRQEGKADGKQQEPEPKQDAKLQQEDRKQQDTKPDAKEADAEEKVADSNSSSSSLEGEQWSASSSSRKRGASCLENESCEKKENSPQIKRAKRCSRTAETQGQQQQDDKEEEEKQEEVPKAEKESRTEACVDSNGGDLSISSGKELVTKEEVEGQVECDGANGKNSYKASNGLKSQDEETSRESSTNSSLLNGGQSGENAAVTTPFDPSVPCPISNAESQNRIEPLGEEIFVAKEPEEEEEVVVEEQVVDLVVGEEQVVESNGQSMERSSPLPAPPPPQPHPDTNNSPINNNSNSGEATPTPTPSSSPQQQPETNECNATTFTELYEHRYTLRTPPKTKSCPSSPPSVTTDNGPVAAIREEVVGGEEADLALEEKIVPSEDIVSEVGASEEVQDGGEEEEEGEEGEEERMEEDLTSKQEEEPCAEEPALKTAEEEEDEEEEEEPDVYYFESDHLALKHNKEYVGGVHFTGERDVLYRF